MSTSPLPNIQFIPVPPFVGLGKVHSSSLLSPIRGLAIQPTNRQAPCHKIMFISTFSGGAAKIEFPLKTTAK
jgi:hypothetical protein